MTKKELMKAIRIEGNKIIIEGIDLSKMGVEFREVIGGYNYYVNVGVDDYRLGNNGNYRSKALKTKCKFIGKSNE